MKECRKEVQKAKGKIGRIKNINIKGNKVIEMVPDLYGNNPDVH